MKGVRGFDWDDANEDHVLRHGVTPEEIEEAAQQRNVVVKTKTVNREKRWRLFGRTDAGRHLVIVFTIRKGLFRAITAYEMNATEKRTYAPKIA